MKPSNPEGGNWLDANELKAKVSIIDVLAKYGLLRDMTPRGDSLSGPSPFHQGHHSLRVNTERQIWNDMNGRPDGDNGRPVAGNVLGLIQALEGCTFRQALEIAASRFTSTEEPPLKVASALREEAVSEEPAPAFGKALRGLRHDVPFLAERGISPKIAKAYGVGAGVRGMMKGLLACPVRSVDGTIQGYTGRRIRDSGQEIPLWRSPAGLPISDHLFGLHRARATKAGRKAIEDFGLILVQSPIDVLKLAEARFLNAVALMSPRISEKQKALIVDPEINPSRRVTLAMDRSEVGRAGRRAIARELIHSAYVRYAVWDALSTNATSPDRLSREELQMLLALPRAVSSHECEPALVGSSAQSSAAVPAHKGASQSGRKRG